MVNGYRWFVTEEGKPMKTPGKTYLTIPMNKELHDKFQYIAAYDGRSMSGQIIYLLNKCVRDFEREHGLIRVDGQ